ncbi:CAP domain-containing protein [Streptomyces sp. NPDC006739]|uniref:CAP domain-containing protein n=1 Tax=Streptomyces sp. NPDC006739 TaxID=3364763 RepID=UPI003689420F
MGNHRSKQPHYRRIVIAAVAVGVVGVPSVAMACVDWRDGAAHHSAAGADAAPAANPTKRSWNDPGWYRHWHSAWADEPTPAPTPTPTATPKTTAPGHRSAAPTHRATAPTHRTTPPPRTVATPTPVPTPTSVAPTPTLKPTPRPTVTPPAPPIPTATATASGVVARVLQLVNAERAKVGCQDLTLNADLTKAAQAHSDDMAAHQNMSHTGSDGSSPGDRITRAGYDWSTYGENVAYGYATPEQVMAAWMASPGHKANILDCAFKEIGVGFAQPNAYWTQDFGATR